MAELVEVTDEADPRLADYRDLRDVELRRHLEAEHGLFLAEGEKVVRRAVEAGYPVRSLLMAPRWLDGLADVLERTDAPCYVVDEALAERVTGFHVHRGALASLERLPLPDLNHLLGAVSGSITGRRTGSAPKSEHDSVPRAVRGTQRIAILEGLVDHANVGAAFRGAAAMGLNAVLVTANCADPLYRRSIKVSMGAVFHVPWTRVDGWPAAIEVLRRYGFVVGALTLSRTAMSLDALESKNYERLALVLGTEGQGVMEETEKHCDLLVTIPMARGVDSLNVGAAAAVAFYATRAKPSVS